VGFEPTVARHYTAFRERHLQPLGHLSVRECIKPQPALTSGFGGEIGGYGWYAWQDSNLRPLGPQPNALSPELQAPAKCANPILPRPRSAGLSKFLPDMWATIGSAIRGEWGSSRKLMGPLGPRSPCPRSGGDWPKQGDHHALIVENDYQGIHDGKWMSILRKFGQGTQRFSDVDMVESLGPLALFGRAWQVF
jgi:hypothetical protein